MKTALSFPTAWLLAISVCASPSAVARGLDWPAFRGPGGDGRAPEASAPVNWDAETNVKWRVPLARPANGSPIVSGERIFLTLAEDDGGKQRSLYCFDRADGAQLWKRTVEYAEVMPTHRSNPYGGSTPAADGEVVVVWHGSAGLHAYDFEGKVLWKRDLGTYRHMWGYGTSPVIHGDRVLLNTGPGEGESAVFCLDLESGATIWKQTEPNFLTAEQIEDKRMAASWCTPVVTTQGERELVINAHPTRIVAYDLEDGALAWSCEGLPSTRGDMVYSSPVLGEDICFVQGGYVGPSIGVRLGGSGDVTETHRVWHNPERMSNCGSGVYVGGLFVLPDMEGFLVALDGQTGEQLWRERIGRGATWSSIVEVGEHLYVTLQSGVTAVFHVSRKGLEVIATNDLGETTNSTPAVADGRLYLRTYEALWCIAGDE
jgi:outer membrane protein assembly factor BamB